MSMMKCSICGLVPEEPVVSARSGLLFEKRLIERHITDHGKCPITGYPLTLGDLITLKPKEGVYKKKSFAQETREYASFVASQSRVPYDDTDLCQTVFQITLLFLFVLIYGCYRIIIALYPEDTDIPVPTLLRPT